MAHVTNHAPAHGSVLAPINRFFAAIGDALVNMAESSSKMRQVKALSALSDEELAKRGLRRQDIARYVFADSYWV